MKSIKYNFIFYATNQILGLIVPLIVTPYISRILGAEGVGIYSYTYSIVYYFMIVALLGMQYYGNRSVAKIRDDKEKLSKVFSEIYFLQLVVASIVTIIYIIFIMLNQKYRIYYIIQIMFVISVAFDISWLYSGLEKFKVTVTRNFIIRILSAVAIFLFVKTKNDLWIYTTIMAATTLLNQLVLWPFVFKAVKIRRVSLKSLIKHIKPTIVLFIPVLGASVYNVMDKIMLGMLSSVEEVGYYENSERILNIPFHIVSALGTVTLPRIANLNKQKDTESIKNIMIKSLRFLLFILIPMMFGIWVVADYIVVLYLGDEFTKAIMPLKILSMILIFKSISQITRQQYLIPMEKDKIYINSTIIGAILNFIINLILIPIYQTIGACIATVITELILVIYQKYKIEKDMKIFKTITKFMIDVLVKSTIMFVLILILGCFIENQIIKTMLQILVGILIYGILQKKFIKQEIIPMFFKNKG